MDYIDKALQMHRKGNIDQAKRYYIKAYQANEGSNPLLFSNLGALYRKDGKNAEAIKVYQSGLTIYPNDIGINLNYSNIIKQSNPSLTIFLHLKVIRSMIRTKTKIKDIKDPIIFLAATMEELGLYSWAYTILKEGIQLIEDNCVLIANLLILTDKHPNHFKMSAEKRKAINNLLECTVSKEDTSKQIEVYYAIANSCIYALKINDSIRFFKKANELFETLTSDNIAPEEKNRLTTGRINSNWNYSNALLKQGEFKEGWKLFDYGLVTQAEGAQKWQRALFKPFNNKELSVWRGESLIKKHLLLLEEQAVGDSMMFLTLLEPIIKESKKVTLVISKRLVPIYSRSYLTYVQSDKLVILDQAQFLERKINSSNFDTQAPMASICQFRFNHITDYGKYCPNIVANLSQTKALKNDLSKKTNSKIVGLSWRGGAKGTRLLQKSIPISFFAIILKDLSEYTFVSLQYGCTDLEIKEFKKHGIEVINLKNINPMKDMDTWLSLVSSCDLVLSIANTTIHGAGSLGIPTKCMLSNFSDWRWLSSKNIKNSYWYPSVNVSHQSEDGKWYTALDEAREWLKSHS